MIIKFKEFNETNLMNATKDGREPKPNEFVKQDPDAFVNQDDEDEKIIYKDKENKPIFNTTQNKDGATPTW